MYGPDLFCAACVGVTTILVSWDWICYDEMTYKIAYSVKDTSDESNGYSEAVFMLSALPRFKAMLKVSATTTTRSA